MHKRKFQTRKGRGCLVIVNFGVDLDGVSRAVDSGGAMLAWVRERRSIECEMGVDGVSDARRGDLRRGSVDASTFGLLVVGVPGLLSISTVELTHWLALFFKVA